MNKFLCLAALIVLAGCTYSNKSTDKPAPPKPASAKTVVDPARPATIRYTDQQLEAFLDSLGRLPQQPLMDKVAFEPDSAFKSQEQLDTLLSPSDFNTLKQAAREGAMPVKVARRIFHNMDISDSCEMESGPKAYKVGFIPVEYYPFSANKHDFKEFALCIGNNWRCVDAFLYFFSGSRIIARDGGYDRDGLDLDYYKDADGKTVVHYNRNFGTGSGTWWDNFNFYKYENNKLIPILDELENGNIQRPYFRARWLESTIKSTNPLTIKMVYYQNFSTYIPSADNGPDYQETSNFINDSTIVRYAWDEQSKTLKGDYERSKLSKAQIMSYYLGDNEYLFINSHYKLLKRMLNDHQERKSVLGYLQRVMADGLK